MSVAEELEQDWIFTFGCGQKHSGHYVKIFGTFDSARAEMFRRYGDEWCMQYTADEFFKNNNTPQYLKETELIENEEVSDEEVLKLFHNMSGTMQKSIIEVMKVTQKEGE